MLTRQEFIAKWGIKSEQELDDIVMILRAVMQSSFKRLRPKWAATFGEDVMKAIEDEER
jgi:hypothetical protein